MRAIVQRRYGEAETALEYREDVPTPRPKTGQVLVRVEAASVHPDIWHVVAGRPLVIRPLLGIRRPRKKVPGIDLCGVVVSLGAGASKFEVGDRVFGEVVSGVQWRNGGTYAEFARAPEDQLELVPDSVDPVIAAAVPTSGLIALQAVVHQAGVVAGQRVLVNGAAGGVGHYSVQIAKAIGAEVTAVDSPGASEMLSSLGADRVLDFTDTDYTQSDERYDAIIDVAVSHPFDQNAAVLTDAGLYVMIGHDHFGQAGSRFLGSLMTFAKMTYAARNTDHLPKNDFKPDPDRMRTLASFLQAGDIKPYIDKTFGLSQVPEALRHLQSPERLGKVVITV